MITFLAMESKLSFLESKTLVIFFFHSKVVRSRFLLSWYFKLVV